MFIFKFTHIRFLVTFTLLIILGCSASLFGQLLGAGFQTVIKAEYQYSDYISYEFPDPILYEYPDVQYSQPQPYIASFPEHRFLTKVTQYFGFETSLGLRYQLGQLDDDNRQHIYNAKLIHEISDLYSVMGAYQYMELNNSSTSAANLTGHMLEFGGKFNFAGAVHIEPSFGFYTSGYFSPDAKEGGGFSGTLKFRQALGNTTALQIKYNYFKVDYTFLDSSDPEHPFEINENYDANTVTVWLSQHLPTESAIHVSNRFYWNSGETKSFSPGLELVHALNWKTILRLSYRYYHNRPKVAGFLERIEGDTFSTNAITGIFDYRLSANTKIALKYRYYTSNQDIDMNTYLFSLEQIF